MVNEREKKIIEQYENNGWKTIRCGAPDFLFLKVKNGEVVESIFVEVKAPNTSLSYEQSIWKKIIEMFGAEYKIEIIK